MKQFLILPTFIRLYFTLISSHLFSSHFVSLSVLTKHGPFSLADDRWIATALHPHLRPLLLCFPLFPANTQPASRAPRANQPCACVCPSWRQLRLLGPGAGAGASYGAALEWEVVQLLWFLRLVSIREFMALVLFESACRSKPLRLRGSPARPVCASARGQLPDSLPAHCERISEHA